MRSVLDYEGQYSVTEDGRIWSHKRNRFLTPHYIKGYLRIGLRDSSDNQNRKMHLVHRLVAEAYIENPDEKPEVNHINSDRSDNRIENLEWATRCENNGHAWKYGNKTFKMTDTHISRISRKLTMNQVAIIRSIYSHGNVTQKEIARQYNVAQATISHIVRGNKYVAA